MSLSNIPKILVEFDDYLEGIGQRIDLSPYHDTETWDNFLTESFHLSKPENTYEI